MHVAFQCHERRECNASYSYTVLVTTSFFTETNEGQHRSFLVVLELHDGIGGGGRMIDKTCLSSGRTGKQYYQLYPFGLTLTIGTLVNNVLVKIAIVWLFKRVYVDANIGQVQRQWFDILVSIFDLVTQSHWLVDDVPQHYFQIPRPCQHRQMIQPRMRTCPCEQEKGNYPQAPSSLSLSSS